MMLKLRYLLCIFLLTAGALEASRHCTDQESCEDINSSCQCYCAEKGDFRKKDPNLDVPYYVEDDPNGIYCYCNKWDYKKYKKGSGPIERPASVRRQQEKAAQKARKRERTMKYDDAKPRKRRRME